MELKGFWSFLSWWMFVTAAPPAAEYPSPISISSPDNTIDNSNENLDLCNPLIIAHRGASGYVPEHTLGGYALAITLGADYVEPDLVMTKDGKLVALHDNELGSTTDVALHKEFEDRHKTKIVDGNELTGWFSEDFTLAEIRTLRARERIPDMRPGNARLDGAFLVPTFQEIIDLVKGMQSSQKRTIGIYPEIKHSTYFKRLGLPMESLVVETLHSNGYYGQNAPIFIQSFEISNLKELKNLTDLKLLQLFESDKKMLPFDQVELSSGLTYGDMATPEGLKEVAKYAYAVGPDKTYIIPRDANNRLGEVTSFVQDSHAVGLKVHPYTFRAENYFLPNEYKSESGLDTDTGDLAGELKAYIDAGVDGFFVEEPDVAFKLRGPCKIDKQLLR